MRSASGAGGARVVSVLNARQVEAGRLGERPIGHRGDLPRQQEAVPGEPASKARVLMRHKERRRRDRRSSRLRRCDSGRLSDNERLQRLLRSAPRCAQRGTSPWTSLRGGGPRRRTGRCRAGTVIVFYARYTSKHTSRLRLRAARSALRLT